MQTTGQTNLMQLATETTLVLNGSFIVFSCISGYVNTGGSLNVTCSSSGAWSQFPNCVPSGGVVTTTTIPGGGGQMTTTIVSGGTGSPCVIDMTSTFNITNGYAAALALTYMTSNTATGNYINDPYLCILFYNEKAQFNLHVYLDMHLIQLLDQPICVIMVNGLPNLDV
jgi:hypothetical protein